jgi:hypothetical protein
LRPTAVVQNGIQIAAVTYSLDEIQAVIAV